MLPLLKKEINGFFGSITGYIVILVFISTCGLLLWVIPGDYNIPGNGYANLDGFFYLAPWLFLFLIPAVTMRMFAEEKRTGTLELLLTRPVSDLGIVTAKYGAAVLLTVFALIPTVVFFISIWWLASPQGNVDAAGIAGSYIGLLFLGSAFAAIGIFCSLLTGNPVVSFILAVLFCFFFYSGFELISSLIPWAPLANFLSYLGVKSHYVSLSKGVIDTRDAVYFISVTLVFLFISRFIIEKRKW